MNLEGYTPGAIRPAGAADRGPLDPEPAGDDDGQAVTEQLEGYHFSDVARGRSTTSPGRSSATGTSRWQGPAARRAASVSDRPTAVQRVLVGVLDGILRLVHPIMPFVAESIWQALNEARLRARLASRREPARRERRASPPGRASRESWHDPAMETRIARMQELVRIVREVRNRYSVDGKTQLDVYVRCSTGRRGGLPGADIRSSRCSAASANSNAARQWRSRSRPRRT